MLLTFLKRFLTSLYLGHLLYSMVGHYISPIPRAWIVMTLTVTNTLLALMSFILLLFLTVAVIMGAKGVDFLINVRYMMLRFVGMAGPVNDHFNQKVFDMIGRGDGEGQAESDSWETEDTSESDHEDSSQKRPPSATRTCFVTVDTGCGRIKKEFGLTDEDSNNDGVDLAPYPLAFMFEADTESE